MNSNFTHITLRTLICDLRSISRSQWRNYGGWKWGARAPQPRSVPTSAPIQNFEKIGTHLRLQGIFFDMSPPPLEKVVHLAPLPPWKLEPSYATGHSHSPPSLKSPIIVSLFTFSQTKWKSSLSTSLITETCNALNTEVPLIFWK